MDCLSASDVAQLAHENVFKNGDCVQPGIVLRYDSYLPSSSLLEVVYIDDHLAMAIVDRSEARSPHGPDRDVSGKPHAAFMSSEVERSTGKAFCFSVPSATPQACASFWPGAARSTAKQELCLHPFKNI